MNRKELIRLVAEKSEYDFRDVDEIVRAFEESITETVAGGEVVLLTGFAKFARVERPERQARNPSTGATITVGPSKKVKITPLKAFKDTVLNG